jgi:hypothetical protein
LSTARGAITLWIRANDWEPKSSREFHHFEGGSVKSDRLIIYKYNENPRIVFLLGPLSGGPRVGADFSNWKQGSWHHLCANWDENTLELYLDGEKAAETQRKDAVTPAVISRIQFGEYWAGNPGSSAIDEVRFFDGKLTPEEIREDFNANSGKLPPPAEPDPVAAFSFDATVGADIGNATPAKVVRGNDKTPETMLMDGVSGKSLRIGNSQDGTIGQTTEFTLTPGISAKTATVSMWLRANDWTPATNKEFQHFLGGFSKSERLVIYKYYQNSRVNVLLGPLSKGNAVARFDMKDWAPGTWHHLCATWTPTELELYVDGRQVSQAKRTTPPGATDFQRIQFGEMWSGKPGSSSVDEVRIFDRKLNAAEIQLLYKRNAK